MSKRNTTGKASTPTTSKGKGSGKGVKPTAEKTPVIPPTEAGEPNTTPKQTVKQLMKDNPQGNHCSGCGKLVPTAAKGTVACVCPTCLAERTAAPRKAVQPHEKYTPKAKRATTRTNGTAEMPGGILAAVMTVLGDAPKGMHAKAIAEAITTRGLWSTPSKVTPIATIVNSSTSGSIHKHGDKSPFIKVGPCTYALK